MSPKASIRSRSKDTRQYLTSLLAERGVTERGFSRITNTIYEGLFGLSCRGILAKFHLMASANVRDHLSRVDLAKLAYTEALITEELEEDEDISGDEECEELAKGIAEDVGDASVTIEKYHRSHVKV